MDSFKVRINCVDHYQSRQLQFDPELYQADGRRNADGRVPVLRIFGATENGQKVCAHVHGVFPYLYIEYDGDLDPGAGTLDHLIWEHMY